jgi:hypothetical protein
MPHIIGRHHIKGAMLVVMSGVSMGSNVQGVAAGVIAPGCVVLLPVVAVIILQHCGCVCVTGKLS